MVEKQQQQAGLGYNVKEEGYNFCLIVLRNTSEPRIRADACTRYRNRYGNNNNNSSRKQKHPDCSSSYDKTPKSRLSISLKKVQRRISAEKKREIYSWLCRLSKSVRIWRKKKQMSHSTQYSPPTCAGSQGHQEDLLVPLGHLLTQSLDVAEFGLRGDLCDAPGADSFEEHRTLGERARPGGWGGIEFADTNGLLHAQEKHFKSLPNSCSSALSTPVQR